MAKPESKAWAELKEDWPGGPVGGDPVIEPPGRHSGVNKPAMHRSVV
jgi:hypothetical protein